MYTSTVFFFVSLVALIGMVVSKLVSMKNNTPSISAPLSKFDAPIGKLLVVASVSLQKFSLYFLHQTKVLSHSVVHLFSVYLHRFVQIIERRLRAWREFAREKKIERKPASAFIKDVFEYKNQIKDKREM